MANNSRILAWKIPWTEEPGRLQSMGSQRVGHDWLSEWITTTGRVKIKQKSPAGVQEIQEGRNVRNCKNLGNSRKPTTAYRICHNRMPANWLPSVHSYYQWTRVFPIISPSRNSSAWQNLTQHLSTAPNSPRDRNDIKLTNNNAAQKKNSKSLIHVKWFSIS